KDEKKVNEEPGKEGGDPSKEDERDDQEKDASVNSTNNVNAASTNEVNVVGRKASIELPDEPNMSALEDIVYSDDDDEDVGAEADMNNLDAFMSVSPIPTIRVHKDHPVEQIIRDLNLAPQTRRMTKNLEEHEPKKVIQALQDPSWIEAMQDELLQFKLQKVRTLVDLPNGKSPIGTKWVLSNKKDERGIMIKNKARLVAQGYIQEERIVYDEMDVKSDFLYSNIKEEVYVCQPPGFEEPDFPDRVYKVAKALYELHQALRACFTDVKTARPPMILKNFGGSRDENVCACARYQVNPKVSHLHVVKRIFRYLKGQPKLGLWYPKDFPFDLVAYTDSDYSGASLDRKSTTGGCQFLRSRLISWQCKKQTVVANSNKPEYVAASSCCGQQAHLWKLKLLLKDEDGKEVDVHLYKSMIGSLMNLISSRPDIMFAVCACVRYQVNLKVSYLHAVKRIFRLISWQCKKQTMVANSTTEVEDCNEKKLIPMVKIHTNKNVADVLTKAFDVSRRNFLLLLKVNAARHNLLLLLKVNAARHNLQLLVNINDVEVDGKKIIVIETSVRRDLQLNDEEGTDCLPNATIFGELTRMGYEKLSQNLTFYKAFFSPQCKFLIHTILQCLSAKTTAWNEFSSTMASVIICLATNQKFNFSKYIFESMVKNLENVSGKFLMYPRFIQVFLEKQLEGISNHKRIYVTPSHTKKNFENMRRVGKGFSRRETPLFPTMMKQKPRKPKRKDTEVPQPSGPTDNVVDEAVNEEIDDSLERASTTATYLDAEYDRGNINKTQSKATLNKPNSLGTSLGCGPRRQETMGNTIAQTGFENVSKTSNDSLLVGVNTPRSDEYSLKVGRSVRVISSDEASLGDQEDASKQERKIDDIDKDTKITLVDETQGRYGDEEMFDTCVLDDEEVFVGQDMAKKEVNMAEKEISIADPVTTTGEVVTTASFEISTASPSYNNYSFKEVVIGEQSESTTRTRPQQLPSKDKGKAIMEAPEKPTKRKDQIRHDEEVAQRLQAQLQAELEEEDRLVDDDKETTELKNLMEVMPDEEEVALNVISLVVKSLSIIDWKIHKEGKKSYYQIIRANGSSKMYLVFSHMLKSFNREDLETLYKLVKDKYGSARPVKDLDLVLYGDLKTMFEPHVEDNV
ncbi:ribonuclease H-like domain-containing protein, partial [Tanacetum coccineum]